MWRSHLFFLGSRLDTRWQEFGFVTENKSRERCGSRASSPHLLFYARKLTCQRPGADVLSADTCCVQASKKCHLARDLVTAAPRLLRAQSSFMIRQWCAIEQLVDARPCVLRPLTPGKPSRRTQETLRRQHHQSRSKLPACKKLPRRDQRPARLPLRPRQEKAVAARQRRQRQARAANQTSWSRGGSSAFAVW